MENKAFHKYKNEYIEGFLSDKAHFNGVLFLLKEPNSNGKEQCEFWFRNGLLDSTTLEKNSKRAFTLYKNKFNIYLGYLKGNYNLYDCAYANIRPSNGKSAESKEYKNLKDNDKYNRFLSIVEECENKIEYVFTCYDIFDALLKEGDGKLLNVQGIEYHNSNGSILTKRVMEINGIIVYEIYHPSYTKYPKEK